MKKIFTLMTLSVGLLSSCLENEAAEEAPYVIDPVEPIVLSRAETNACQQVQDFAFDFVREINATADGNNYFVSPLSAEIALAMICNGTSGETEHEIRKVLGFEDFTINDLNTYNMKMLKILPRIDNRTKLAFANGVWARNTLSLKPEYQDMITKMYDGACISFDNLDNVKKKINSWCDEHTDHMIREIMGQDDYFDFALANAMYFKGEWTRGFKTENTRKKPFYNLDGTTSEVQMMQMADDTGCLEYGYDDNCRMLFMPFGNKAYSFVVVMPTENHTLEDCLQYLDNKTLNEFQSHNKCFGDCSLVEMPRFTLNYICSLKETLQRMGITQLFSGKAELPKMFEDVSPVDINAKQSACIEVNEAGAKAAAVTVVEVDTTALCPSDEWEFIVDRPFLFLVREQITGTILFTGRVNKL